MPGPSVPLVIAAQILMVASNGPPRVDVQSSCRASEEQITKLFGTTTMVTIGGCMRQENDARGQIEKNWTTYPAAHRTLCAQTSAYMPSYVEWLTCFEMQRDVKKMKAEEAAAARRESQPK